MLITTLLLTATYLIINGASISNAAEGYFLAKYDLYTNHPKLYIYGYVVPSAMDKKYKQSNIALVFRGCIIGGARYDREKSYNQVIISELSFNRYIYATPEN